MGPEDKPPNLSSTINSVAGTIQFCVESEDNAPSKARSFVRINHDVSVEQLSNFMISSWGLQPPDIVLSIISGHRSFRNWKKSEYQDTFQHGFARLFRTVTAWIFDDGYNHGIGKIVGAAVKAEEDRRFRNVIWKGRYKRFQTVVPKIVAVSMPFLDDLGSSRRYIDDVMPSTDGNRNGSDIRYASQPVVYRINDQTVRGSAHQYDIDPSHTNYMLIDGTANAQQVANLRCRTVQAVHTFANLRHGVSHERMRMFSNDSGSSSDDDGTITGNGILTPAITPDVSGRNDLQFSRSAINRIPLVIICIQGGPEQLEQILYFLERNIPVIVVNGSGFLADLIATMFQEFYADGSLCVDRDEMLAVKKEVLAKFKKRFPHDTQLDRAETADKIFDQFCAVIFNAVKSDGRQLITVLDLKAAVEFSSLEDYLLNAIMTAEDGRNASRSPGSVQAKLKMQLLLCVKWNEDGIVQKRLFSSTQSHSSSAQPLYTKFKVDADVFEMALVLKHRHKFINMFLERNFKVHRYLSHRRLLVLFRRAEDTEFFHSVVFEGLLNQPAGALPDERYVCVDLPELIRTLTGTSQVIDAYQLTSSSYGLYAVDAVEAERRARLALLIWAVLMNRFDLAHVIWRHCDDPIPTALFVSHMFQSLRKVCSEPEMSNRLQQHSETFSDLAYNVLDSGYNDAAVLAFEILEQNYADFQNKTPLLMAYEAHNKKFLIHPCCQKWLQHLYYGRMNVRKRVKLRFASFSWRRWLNDWVPESVKILSAAWFILPIFVWISFPFIYAVDPTLLHRTTNDIEDEENGELAQTNAEKNEGNDSVVEVLDESSANGGNSMYYYYSREANEIDGDELLLAEAYQFGPEITVPRSSGRRHYSSIAGISNTIRTQPSLDIAQNRYRLSNSLCADEASKRNSSIISFTANDVSSMPSKSSCAVNPLVKRAFSAAQQKAASGAFSCNDPNNELSVPSTDNNSPKSFRSVSQSNAVLPASSSSMRNTIMPLSPLTPTATDGEAEPAVDIDPSGGDSTGSQTLSASARQQQQRFFLSVPSCKSSLGAVRPPTSRLYSKTPLTLNVPPSDAEATNSGRKVSSISSNYPTLSAANNSHSNNRIMTTGLFDSNYYIKPPSSLHVDEELARIADIQRGYHHVHGLRSRRSRIDPSRSSFNSADAKSASLPLWDKIRYVWTAPITKHYSYCAWHILFLIVYSIAALMPSCDKVRTAFTLDSVVWLWTLAIGVELTVRTLKQSDRGHPIYLSNRLLEITFIFALLAARMALPIMDAHGIINHPMLSRVVALIGLLYFFIRIIFDFMPLSKTLGPWLFKVRNMVRYGFVLWIMLILPYLIASMVVIQASLYPDKPLSFGTVLQAAERVFVSFFITPMSEVTSITPQCNATKFTMWDERNASQTCMAGGNADSECPTSSVWSYFFLFQFFFTFKIVFATLLFAVFGVYMYTNNEITNINWRFHRYRRLLDFETRCAVPPPFSLIPHCGWMLQLLWKGLCRGNMHKNHKQDGTTSDAKKTSLTLFESPVQSYPHATARMNRLMHRSHYWKALATNVWNAQQKQEKSAGMTAEVATASSALVKLSEELQQLKITMKRWKKSAVRGDTDGSRPTAKAVDKSDAELVRVLPKLMLDGENIDIRDPLTIRPHV